MIGRFIPLAALFLAAPLAAAQPVDGKIQWVFDYELGKQLSETTGKPMFVVFRCER